MAGRLNYELNYEPLEPRALLASHGLGVAYFNNTDFTGSVANGIDPSINYDWGNHLSPAPPSIKGTTFSARWMGLVKPLYSERYTFSVRSNDGVRVWLAGKLIIDSWKAQPRATHTGSVTLGADKLYDLRIEYFDSARTAAITLYWKSASQPSQPIPKGRLYAYDQRFAAVGDFGRDDSNEADVAAMIDRWSPRVVVSVGDDTYNDNLHQDVGAYYGRYVSSNRFFSVMGNHDWDNGVDRYTSYFDFPGNERYYDFTLGRIHFFMIDSDPREPDGIDAGSAQAQWLKAKLQASTSTFNVVMMHHPPYASGEEGPEPAMRWPFKQWGADVVIAGHTHNYERLNIGAMTYLIDGAGAATDPIGPAVPGSVVRDNSDVGALLISANDMAMTFQYQLRSGQVVDTFTLRPG